ncbi:hypothetical protein SADUNF_Sadunf04G0146500 [Salix dunnii]|uniref:Uncharacterized protein n=1 Tax=Salix dunnii TaxID=1413687 RepID=A0A835K5R8_9ROSI|nr:hypothetical protein SADUNF_Sadunf04G0146500 [Salix dunnii]
MQCPRCKILKKWTRQKKWGSERGRRGDFGLWKRCGFEKQLLGVEGNGIKEEYQLADEGVFQARLAGELFLKSMVLVEEQIVRVRAFRILTLAARLCTSNFLSVHVWN